MAITLFTRTDFRGDDATITGDTPSLGALAVGAHPSSARIAAPTTAALFFRREGFQGHCLYRRGPRTIADLGKASEGGKATWGNTIASVRVTPFRLQLNVNVISQEDGTLPGGFASPQDARRRVDGLVAITNSILGTQRALITLEFAQFNIRQSDRRFDVDHPRVAAYPAEWKERGQVDVVVCNQGRRKGQAGVTKPPCLGQVILLAAQLRFDNPISGEEQTVNAADDLMGVSLAHELGHYCGVHHPSGRQDPANIMNARAIASFNPFTGAFDGPALTDLSLDEDQIGDMHSSLAGVRERDRH